MEFPLIPKSYQKNQKSLAIVYPNLYYGGVYCLAPLIFYNLVNKEKEWRCDRKFLDKDKDLKNYDLIGFTFQYELDIKNIKQLIKKHNLKNKITFAGGPVPNINPNILKNIVDFQILGEIEEILPKILKLYNKDKKIFLKNIQNIQGVITKNTKHLSYAQNKNPLTAKTYPIYQPLPKKLTKNFVFQNSFLLEIERGCPFNCKFCPINSIYKQIKYYPLKEIKKIIDQGTKINKRNKIIIYSPSFTHPKRKEILKYILKKGLKASIPSTKIEFTDKETLELLKKLGQKTITIAPECNESLRKTLNKQITNKQIINFLKKTKDFKIKAYFLLGLPNQTKKDIEKTIELIHEMKKVNKNLYISFNPFVPKPRTLFQKEKFRKKEIKQQIKLIKKHLKVKFKIPSVSTSEKEYKITNSLD